jgi:hypothetical protein
MGWEIGKFDLLAKDKGITLRAWDNNLKHLISICENKGHIRHRQTIGSSPK